MSNTKTAPDHQEEEYPVDGEIVDEKLDSEELEVFSYPVDNTLAVYHQLWENDDLILPEFQREYIWDIKKASRLIESFLLGFPVPPVFLYMLKDTGKYLIIDGNQRMTSIVSFLEGNFIGINRRDVNNDDSQGSGKVFRLKGVSNQDWENKTFKQLEEKYRTKLQQGIVRATVIKQLDDDYTLPIHQVFERLNTGGIRLSPMEVRMCVSSGSFSRRLREVNKHSLWMKLIRKRKQDKRVRDIEWILRVIALFDNIENYDSPMRSFLDDYMFKHKDEDDRWLDEKIEVFENALKRASRIADDPFNVTGRAINLSAMDSILVTLMSLDGKEIDEEKLKKIYNKIMSENSEYRKKITNWAGTASKENVLNRIKYVKDSFSAACKG